MGKAEWLLMCPLIVDAEKSHQNPADTTHRANPSKSHIRLDEPSECWSHLVEMSHKNPAVTSHGGEPSERCVVTSPRDELLKPCGHNNPFDMRSKYRKG